MPNEITPETLREWADEADDGEEIVLSSNVLRQLAEQLEKARETDRALSEALERAN